MSTADELKKLKELLDEGVLSQEEFDSEKKKLLGNKDEIKNKSTKSEKELELEESLKNIKNTAGKRNRKKAKENPNSENNEPEEGKKKSWYIKGVLGVLVLFFIIGSLPEPSNNPSPNSSSNSSSSSSSSNSSICTNWANSTGSNASEFGRILGNSTTILQNALEGKVTYAEAVNNLNSDVKKLKTIESRQKNLTPNSGNDYSHKMFLLGIDSMIKGLEYSATGLETEYNPTLESGIELITMGTEQVSKATDSINSC